MDAGDINASTIASDGVYESTGNIVISSISGSIILNNDISTSTWGLNGVKPLPNGAYESSRNGNVSILSASGDINVGNISTGSYSEIYAPANAGDIIISTTTTSRMSGKITTGDLRSESISVGGPAQDGGDIIISTMSGDIDITNRTMLENSDDLYRRSLSTISSGYNSEDGGDITIKSEYGDILITNNLRSSSDSRIENLRYGGDIAISTNSGSIRLLNAELNSSTTLQNSELGLSPIENIETTDSSDSNLLGEGGTVEIEGHQISLINTAITSTAEPGRAGDIRLTAEGPVRIRNSRLISGTQPISENSSGANIEISGKSIDITDFSLLSNASFSTSTDRNFNRATRNISLTSRDDIVLSNSSLFSLTTGNRNSGRIELYAGGKIVLTGNSLISSTVSLGATGEGDDIILEAEEGILLQGASNSFSFDQLESSIDSEFTLGDASNTNVLFPSFIPFVTKSELTSSEVFTFSVDTPGTLLIFDVDTFRNDETLDDLALRLEQVTDSNGNLLGDLLDRDSIEDSVDRGIELGRNIDAPQDLGAEGSLTSDDPYLTYVANEPGIYAIAVLAEPLDPDVPGLIFSEDLIPHTLNISKFEPSITSGISTQTDSGEPAGDIRISTPWLTLEQSPQISAETRGNSEAGNIVVQPHQDGKSITLNFVGNNNLISSSSLPISELINASDVTGNGGDVILRAPEAINLNGQGTIRVSTETAGAAGSISLKSPTISIEETALSASTNSTGLGGDIEFFTSQLTIENAASASASSTATGRAGNITINEGQPAASHVTINGIGSRLEARAQESESNAGTVQINAENLFLQNGAVISTSNVSSRSEGITLRGLELLQVLNGSQITASTDTGIAGSISINNQESPANLVAVSGVGSSIAAQASGINGSARDVLINTQRLKIDNGSEVTVSSENGEAGSVLVDAGTVNLDNGKLLAITGSGDDGGNIQLTLSGELLRLSNNSLISAEALGEANGGNIIFTVDEGFIIGGAFENSDIIANASRGAGGNIDISTLSLIGFEERQDSFEQLRSNRTSDISASSEFGQQGTINISTLDLDPNQDLSELPVIDPSPDVQRGCSAEAVGTSSFTVTGRGGLPPSPTDILGQDRILADLGPEPDSSNATTISHRESNEEQSEPILEARGFVKDANGQVTFIAQAPNAAPHESWQQPLQCSGNYSVSQSSEEQ
ncbi:MAG: hypothetical protein AAGA75_24365 [Cyanobacteria bacterium P01_E01_bin.6]